MIIKGDTGCGRNKIRKPESHKYIRILENCEKCVVLISLLYTMVKKTADTQHTDAPLGKLKHCNFKWEGES